VSQIGLSPLKDIYAKQNNKSCRNILSKRVKYKFPTINDIINFS
jgi:hypothetical protein